MRHWVLGLLVVGCSGDDGSPRAQGLPLPPGRDTVDTHLDFIRPTPWECFSRSTVDTQGDGREEYVSYEVYDPARRDLMLHEEHDQWDDGRIEWALDQEFDVDGNLTRAAQDSDGDGAPDEVTRWVRDAAGLLIEEAFDADGDGLDDEIWTWTRDVDGNILIEELDADGDGSPDEIREWLYADGREQTMFEDLDADGVTDLTHAYVYDVDDRLVRLEGDAGDGPPLEYLAEYTWPGPYDSYTRTVDEDGDGIIDETIVIGLDERGLLASQDLDLDGNDHFEAGWHDVVWDADERFVAGLFYVDPDPNGFVAADVWTYDYTFANATGPWYLVQMVEHHDGWDGPVDSTYLATYDWICP